MKELLIGIHLVGLSMSFIKALTIDMGIARQLLFGVPTRPENRNLVALRVGFGLLLISGLGLILLYWVQSPALLANPKILAKSVIVIIAGLNGCAIERLVLGQGLEARDFDRSSLWEPKTLMTIGLLSVSWSSWFGAFALGVWKSINFITSFQVLLVAYVALITTFALGLGVTNYIRSKRQMRLI